MIRALLAGLLFQAALALANPCAIPGMDGAGMGGSGHQEDGSGIGGSGHREDGSGSGGTGHDGDGSGMGGTGARAEATGMGGTGARAEATGMGGTGIVGIITGFGSICVNGLRVTYDADTPVSVDGEASSTAQLAIGQLVSVQAEGNVNSLRARRIALISALVGPVTWVSPKGDTFVALGQRINLSPAGGPLGASRGLRPKPGDVVRVSGQRDATGTVQATLVERARPGAPTSITASLDYLSGNVGRVGGLNAIGVKSLPAGQEVRLTGTLNNGVLTVRESRIAPTLAATLRPERLILQGVVRSSGKDELNIGYTRLSTEARMTRTARPGTWVRIEAVDRGREMPEVVRLDIVRPAGRESDTQRRAVSFRNSSETEREDEEPVHRPVSGEKPEAAEKADKLEKPEEVEKVERVEKPEKVEKVERVEKPEKVEKAERVEKPEKVEKVERVEKPEKVEKVERVEKPEKVEKVERVEKPEKVEKVERVEKPEKVERD